MNWMEWKRRVSQSGSVASVEDRAGADPGFRIRGQGGGGGLISLFTSGGGYGRGVSLL